MPFEKLTPRSFTSVEVQANVPAAHCNPEAAAAPADAGVRAGVQSAIAGGKRDETMGSAAERKRDEGGKSVFLLTGFTQTGGIRSYAFDGLVDARRVHYTVAVDLGLIPGYGIRIQDLPLLCRDLLLERAQPEETNALVFTEQQMRCHAEKLELARASAEQRKKAPRHVVSPDAGSAWRGPAR